MENDFRLKDFFKTYKAKGGKLPLKEYKLIMQTFLRETRKEMLNGNSLYMGYRLGTLRVVRKERNYKHPTINWGESNKYKAILLAEGKELYNKETDTGEKWLCYFTDSYFYMYDWKKDKVKAIGSVAVLHNVLFYELKPFRVAQRALTESVKNNELAPVIHELQPNNQRGNYRKSNAGLSSEQYQLESEWL